MKMPLNAIRIIRYKLCPECYVSFLHFHVCFPFSVWCSLWSLQVCFLVYDDYCVHIQNVQQYVQVKYCHFWVLSPYSPRVDLSVMTLNYSLTRTLTVNSKQSSKSAQSVTFFSVTVKPSWRSRPQFSNNKAQNRHPTASTGLIRAKSDQDPGFSIISSSSHTCLEGCIIIALKLTVVIKLFCSPQS